MTTEVTERTRTQILDKLKEHMENDPEETLFTPSEFNFEVLFPVVHQLVNQIDCGTKRLPGEDNDWRAGPVQDACGAWDLRKTFQSIQNLLITESMDQKTIKNKLIKLHGNPYF